MSYTVVQVKELRERTGSGVLDCKAALEATNGDIEKAIEFLRKKGMAQAEKKAERKLAAGVVDAYIHPGERLGVLLEIDCETDFVARNQEFRQFAHDIAMQIAAYDPLAISREEVPAENVAREKEIFQSQLADAKKPPQVVEKIIAGKLEKYYSEVCVLEQPFVKNPDKRVGDYLKEQIAKFGENIRIKRFARFKLGV
jgi:elongation factor Ts